MNEQCPEISNCFNCVYRLFFKPLPDSTFSCCEYGETVKDIDLNTGLSPKVAMHRTGEKTCKLHGFGKSICEPDENDPFKINPVRLKGEEELKKLLGL